MIKIQQNYSLKPSNSFGLESVANTFIETDDISELQSFLTTHPFNSTSCLLLGTGSNLLLNSPFIDTVIHPTSQEITLLEEREDAVLVQCGSGKDWDEFVAWTVNHKYGGLENLSLIPGSVGAAPIQNIGAYGAEASGSIESVGVLDLITLKKFRLTKKECHFGYRDSIFKNPCHKSWLVWDVCFLLGKEAQPNLTYKPLQHEFPTGYQPDIQEIREAVIRIRRSKLPDPAEIGNAGSFFKNPIVTPSHVARLKKKFPDIPTYPHDQDSLKIPAGWLIEQCGWKGFRDGPVGVYPKQALVLVNYGNATAAELLRLANNIIESVNQSFGITLEMEVRLI